LGLLIAGLSTKKRLVTSDAFVSHPAREEYEEDMGDGYLIAIEKRMNP
jgi:hypothetical protein